MQFALVESKPIQAGPDAPHYAQCVYCGMPVELNIREHDHPFWRDSVEYFYEHTSDLSATECQKLRDKEQAELDKVLNVSR